MTQTIEYVVKVNATAAQNAVAEIEKRFGGVDSVVARVDKGIVAFHRDLQDLNAAIAKGGPNVAHYQRELERLSGTMSGSGGGGRGGAGGGGGRNVGQAALEASRAIEDLQYGFNGIINNIPSLVMGLGAGAGVAGAFSLVAVAGYQVYKNADSISAAFGGTAAETKVLKAQIKDLGDEFNKNLNAKMQTGIDRLKDLKEELRDFGLSSRDKTIEEEYRTLEDMERRRNNLAENRRFLQAKANAAESARNKTLYADQKAVLDEADRRAAALDVAIKQTETRIIDLNRTAAAIRVKEKQAAARDARGRAGGGGTAADDKMVVESGSDAFVTQGEEADQKRREKLNELAINEALRRDERIAANEEMFANIRYEQQKAQADRLKALWTDYGTDVAAAVGEFAASAAMGQEDALDRLLGVASQQAGGFVMLEGGKVMATGIAGMITAPNPMSAAQIAGGAALVAAGAAIQTGGPAAVSALMGKSGAGGGSGSTGASSATRDPGASPRGTTGSSSGGPMIINVSYGAGGPLPEDVAREIHRVVSSGNRRRGAA